MGGSPADGSLPASCDQRGRVGNAMGCAMRQKVGRSYIADAVQSFGCLGPLVARAAQSPDLWLPYVFTSPEQAAGAGVA
jgi:hypothetical protein